MKVPVIVLIILATCSAIKLRNHNLYYQIQSSEFAEEVVSSIRYVSIAGNRIWFEGCNLNFANIRQSNRSFSIGDFASSRKACPEDYDSQFIKNLQQASRMQKQGTKIRFYNSTGRQILVLNQIDQIDQI